MKLHDGAIYGLAAHPQKDMIAISSYSGFVQIWDYGLHPKEMKFSRKFEKLMGHCLAFDPSGNYLAVGFTNGVVKILTARWLKVYFTQRKH